MELAQSRVLDVYLLSTILVIPIHAIAMSISITKPQTLHLNRPTNINIRLCKTLHKMAFELDEGSVCIDIRLVLGKLPSSSTLAGSQGATCPSKSRKGASPQGDTIPLHISAPSTSHSPQATLELALPNSFPSIPDISPILNHEDHRINDS